MLGINYGGNIMETKRCSRCNAHNTLQSKECWNCGADLTFKGFVKSTVWAIIILVAISMYQSYKN